MASISMKITTYLLIPLWVLLSTNAVFAQIDTIYLIASRILDVESGQYLTNKVIKVHEDRIVAIADRDAVNVFSPIDLGDLTILPGLMDMHTHLSFGDPRHPRKLNPMRTLYAGFTTVRDVGSQFLPRFNTYEDILIRDKIQRGELIGPRMYVSGQSLGLGVTRGEQYVADLDVIPSMQEEYVAGVEQRHRLGVDWIKVHVTTGFKKFPDKEHGFQIVSDEEIAAIVKTANKHGLKVAAHCMSNTAIKASIKAGVASIEHGGYLDKESIDMMMANGAYLVPSAKIETPEFARLKYGDRALDDLMLYYHHKVKYLKMAYEKGVKIAFGTDAGVLDHGDNAVEFGRLVELGFSNIDAIRTATLNTAALLGNNEIGCIKIGAKADIIAVAGDPLQDISTLKEVKFVMKNGIIYKYEKE